MIIRKYVPELKKFPTEYIFEPWKAPLEIQIKAKCIIGKVYPGPMVDHDQVYKENQEKLFKFFSDEKRKVDSKNEEILKETKVLVAANLEEFEKFIYYRFLNFDKDKKSKTKK